MFTGIIAALGQVTTLQPKGGDLRLHIDIGKLDRSDIKLGDSIAINGVCLTVVQSDGVQLAFDVSKETIDRSSLQSLKTGNKVNLEKALAVGDRLGGHFVSGHVDGLGRITAMQEVARSWQITVAVPADLQRYIAEKGSICIDGVSLTVNSVNRDGFMVNIIPHTMQETIIQDYQIGTKVNLEVDLIARYLERLLPDAPQKLTPEFLKQHGYLST
ncbi:Riboflavin synthase alpha chain [Methylophaga frappieri]|uniref:Riboflavin synthase n=1 Tax=Methylophaga frappieri (strain ATCC BAA-2434 / DSM 25690 / JAM7) TaxID=754477 RepID=I1YKX5_METFJ|nr:riboflavin synthase [Methylophaga frappieri]AFJ03568.1 Riboflavin synthase alpha chain [Methylophaga frappieri]